MRTWLARLTGGFNALFRKRRVEQDLDEELRSYLESSADQKIRGGMAREDAVRAARMEIGSVEAVKDYTRDVGWGPVLDSLWQDVRFACRLLRRNPGFSAAATITLALGIGANTAVFSIIDATLLKPLPFQHADRLVDILEIRRPGTAEEAAYSGMARARLEEWRAQTHIFDGIGARKAPRPMSMGQSGPAIRVARVSGDLFPLLGLSPVIGRNFSAEEFAPGNDQVLLISDGLWQRAFASSREVIGQQMLLDNRTVTVIGVMPPAARFPVGGDAWLPLTDAIDPQDPASGIVGVVARLREGLTPTSAQAGVARAAEAIQATRRTREPWTARVESIDPRGWRSGSQPIVLVAFGAVAFVLLTACANIAGLLLARTSARQRELAIRAAIGASHARLARQLLVESLVLASSGGVAAILLLVWLIPSIPAVLPPRFIAFPVHEVEIDLRVLAAAIGTALLAGVLSGVLPALRGSRSGTVTSLGLTPAITATRAHRRIRDLLVGAQAAFAAVLLVGAGLMTGSFVRMVASDPGYRLDGLLAASVSVPSSRDASRAPQASFFADLLERVRATPGVSGVTLGTPPPHDLAGSLAAEDRQNDPDSRAGAALLRADPDYFTVLGIPIVSGRAFSPDDRAGNVPVAVIDEETARWFWPGQSALGKRVRYSPYVPWMTVVGVAGDVKTSRAGGSVRSFELYRPLAQDSQLAGTAIMFRADSDERSVLAAVRTYAEALDPEATMTSAGPVRDLYDASFANRRFTALVMSAFAALALLTAAVGLYATLAYTVSRRTREIGVRMALGASRSDVIRLVVAEALVPVVAGLTVGIAASQALSRVIAAQLYQMTPHDPLTLTVVLVCFAAVAIAAAQGPARRATRVDPVGALRAE